ncbi:hypothetical protein DJ70_10540 [Halorubrum halodurans]|uniref:Uncharacterized protein n=1 Tax=Halorubrum halodurans TaxID=1383851 RepID=A0A256II09_9EURY|nr:hypothetical protein DJ70_10540 [Halorubrum halodurans]
MAVVTVPVTTCSRAAGTLEVSTADPRSVVYDRSAGALEVLSAGLLVDSYNRTAGVVAVSAASSAATIYQRPAGNLAEFPVNPRPSRSSRRPSRRPPTRGGCRARPGGRSPRCRTP